jgi:isoamylase
MLTIKKRETEGEVHSQADGMPVSRATAGLPAPLGATIVDGGVNFSLYSRTSTGVTLDLFDHVDDAQAARSITLDPVVNRTYHYWHVFVPNLKSGQLYGYRVDGPADPANGLRFDSKKLVLDPYGRGIATPSNYNRTAAYEPGDNAASAMKSVLVDGAAYDWEGDVPLRLPSSRMVIYEMHVRGFTRHPNSGVAEPQRGTYAGFIEKIPYLKELGINAVELLPIFAFDPHDAPLGRNNYWGYAPVSFFAPHAAFCSSADPLAPIREFRDMVKALHRAGIEVILDVVFNHTAEGSEQGPTLCFRGIDNPSYYILEPNRSYYSNFTGCGNTLNANHPIVRRMIVDCLRYWVSEMHVDGFRFDLASILSRDSAGNVLPNPPVLWDIESDPELAGIKLIAEAWDAAGLYQVGSFIGDSWKEWNGKFRDDVRDFWRGEPGTVGRLADRMLGSHEVYGHKRREAEQSVNFVTCHDGFTLNDLVSYNEKHNEANGEGNRDGANDNRSWNCGVEGPSDDAEIESLRLRQIKNFFTVTLLSLGVPMFAMGDEVRRTQRGNNNAYCQDDELSWFDWSLVETHAEIYRFAQQLLKRRVLRNIENEQQRVSLSEMLHHAKLSWHGQKLLQPDWGRDSHAFAFTAELQRERQMLHVIVNGYWEAIEFELPPAIENRGWRRWIDTALPSPQDIVDWEMAVPISDAPYAAGARSVVMLFADTAPDSN